jgi:RNA polymerase sigma factor (sigma-70 family)
MDEATRRRLDRDMIALADGDRNAFDPVYRILWPLLVRFIGAVCRDRMVAEDMTQQAMLKILAKASTFDRSQDTLAWSMAIAVNEYRSYRRKLGNRAMEPIDEALSVLADHDTPEAIAIRNDLGEAARIVLSGLRPQDREAVIAAICEGQRPTLTAVAFRKRLQHALANARLLWKTRYGDDQI